LSLACTVAVRFLFIVPMFSAGASRTAAGSLAKQLLCAAAILLAAAGPGSAQEQPWQQAGPHARWTPLTVTGIPRIGFTWLDAQLTQIKFTNSLDETAAAANRVLYDGAGVAVGDFDNDGLPDIYFCSLNGRNTLYRNLGGWKFADVTGRAGLPRDHRYYRGAVFADVNGDGALDLLVCVVGGGVQCFLNDTHGRFIDATAAARTASNFGSITLALADVDGNGTLDLYVANNRAEDIRDRGQVNLQMVNGQLTVPPALTNRLLVMNGEVLEYGEPDQLYLNDGKGHFSPVSWTGGRFRTEEGRPLASAPLDWGLTASFRDLNDDGFPDLYVCNDFWTPDRIWINDGKGRFQAAPRLALRHTSASSMGVDFADIDRDGHVDFFVVDMLSRDPGLRKRQKLAQTPMPSAIGAIDDRPQAMRNTLFRNQGDGTFVEIANYAGVAASEWSWSPVFLDVDLDGYEDLLISTGHAKDVQDLDAAAEIRKRQHPWSKSMSERERQTVFTQELLEHMRLYPQLNTPIVAFHNRGDWRFDDVTANWGTAQPGIHHAMAFADFDGDGDLDFVVNNLGSAAGVYRNDTIAPRVAVRLKGLPPNTEGIGAKIALRGGAVPVQQTEVSCGGHYMSGSDPLAVFAAGTNTAPFTIEVTWRNGRRSVVEQARANRLYEISESGALTVAKTNPPAFKPERLFEDVSQWLQHTHHEEPFNDFERQPLLPRRLSQLGPGVTWFDADGDGYDDLFIASGKGGRLAYFKNKSGTGFERQSSPALDAAASRDQSTLIGWRGAGARDVVIGLMSYEDGASNQSSVIEFDFNRNAIEPRVPDHVASIGPMAMADVRGNGTLEMFVGGRVIPGRYPEAAPSRLYQMNGTNWQIDSINSKALEKIGMASGAVWSDLDGDGSPELILACEWGPLRIFHNERGRLVSWNISTRLNGSHLTLDRLTGFWNGVATVDLDGDGRMDIVASNWGLNSDSAPTMENPVALFYGDLMDRGVVDLIEAERDSKGAFAPRQGLDTLGRSIPALAARFATHQQFSAASLDEILGDSAAKMKRREATTLASMVFLNRGDHFEAAPLPREAQLAPAFGISVADFDGDGNEDIFLAQNFFANAAEAPRLDAGRGLLLRGDGHGNLLPVTPQNAGIEVFGEQRGVAASDYDHDGRADLVVTQNGAATRLFHNIGAKPGLRMRLTGPASNPDGIGAQLRLRFASRIGPAREIHAGSGYWSQESATQVLALPETPTSVIVSWPGGKKSTIAIPPNAREILVTHPSP
jgi:hypothetical protein